MPQVADYTCLLYGKRFALHISMSTQSELLETKGLRPLARVLHDGLSMVDLDSKSDFDSNYEAKQRNLLVIDLLEFNQVAIKAAISLLGVKAKGRKKLDLIKLLVSAFCEAIPNNWTDRQGLRFSEYLSAPLAQVSNSAYA